MGDGCQLTGQFMKTSHNSKSSEVNSQIDLSDVATETQQIKIAQDKMSSIVLPDSLHINVSPLYAQLHNRLPMK